MAGRTDLTRIECLKRRQRAHRRTSILALIVAVVVLGTAGTALAFWTASAVGNAASKGDTLATGATPNTPTTNTPNGNTVTVTFARVNTTGGAAIPASNYTIKRYPTAGGSAVTATVLCSGTGTISCAELSVPDGQWQYTDTPTFGTNWVGPESSKSATVTVDTTKPITASVTTPASGSVLRAATVPANFTGSTADNSGGVGLNANSTTFTLQRSTDSKYWTGSAWQSALFNLATTHLATTSNTAAAWTNATGTLPTWSAQPDATYTVQATATDKVGNTFSGTAITFTLDNTAPSGGSITANSSASASYNTSGTVPLSVTNFTDAGSGIASNAITRAAGTLTNNVCGTLSGSAAVTITAGHDSASLTTGCYRYTLTGTDNAGNTATATSAEVMVDTTAPVLTITSSGANVAYPGSGTTIFFKNSGAGSFTITATDPDTGISATNFPAAPTGWTRTTGTNSATYTLGAAGASSSLTGVSATNNAAAVTSQNVTITLDATNPTVALSFPVNNTTYPIGNSGGSSWTKKSSCTPEGMCGTATDGASGVASVQISVLGPNGKYWDGTFTSGRTRTSPLPRKLS